jgi:hypothetical protein
MAAAYTNSRIRFGFTWARLILIFIEIKFAARR